jgi:hypothetical protein
MVDLSPMFLANAVKLISLFYDRQIQRFAMLTSNIRGSVRHPTLPEMGVMWLCESSQLGQWHIAIVDRGAQQHRISTTIEDD